MSLHGEIPRKSLNASRWRRDVLFLGVAALVTALDQIVKEIVRSSLGRGEYWPSEEWIVRIHHVTNSGAAFGILQGQAGFLIVTTIVGLVAIVMYYRFPPFQHRLVPVAVGMMLGGALGNLIDRIRLGRVTDFIDLPRWPAFNLADSSIVIAVIILILSYTMLSGRRTTDSAPAQSFDDIGRGSTGVDDEDGGVPSDDHQQT